MDTSVDDLPARQDPFSLAGAERALRRGQRRGARGEGRSFSTSAIPSSAGSFIEKGDSVLFSRDKSRTRHIYLELIPATVAQAHASATSPAGLDAGREGEQTQVVFLKRQEYRTDLFGVGAIAFDLIALWPVLRAVLRRASDGSSSTETAPWQRREHDRQVSEGQGRTRRRARTWCTSSSRYGMGCLIRARIRTSS